MKWDQTRKYFWTGLVYYCMGIYYCTGIIATYGKVCYSLQMFGFFYLRIVLLLAESTLNHALKNQNLRTVLISHKYQMRNA